MYLRAVRVEKDDFALEYDAEETPAQIEAQAAKLGLGLLRGRDA
jgi:hypothetical protein